MENCLKCGGRGEYPFRVLEVLTLHIREMSGEKRVQALGEFREYAICDGCARARLDGALRPGKSLWRKLAPYGTVLLFGLAVLAAGWEGGNAFRLLGGAGIFCGIAGGGSLFRRAGEEKRAYSTLPAEKALARAAWECLMETAPQKAGENDLTYIPVNGETLAMKNGDLSLTYDLLPAIARQAWNRLHGAEEEGS